MCQPFQLDTSNPTSFLSGYNQCLQSGCVVDESVSPMQITSVLYKVIQDSGVSAMDKFKALQGIYSGEIGPHNILSKVKQMSENSCSMGNLFSGLLGGGGN